MRTISIDVVSDVVCPWCLIGLRRLERALEEMPDVSAELRLHPFLLDPSAPEGGVDLREHLRKKYGRDPSEMFRVVESAARESGILLDFSKVTRGYPTTRAHVLLRHAASKGTQWKLKQSLLAAYFLEGRDIGDVDVLAGLATDHGFDEEEARALLRDDAELRKTREEAADIAARGIGGVPFFLFAGRLAVSGAQRVETLKEVVERALAESDPT